MSSPFVKHLHLSKVIQLLCKCIQRAEPHFSPSDHMITRRLAKTELGCRLNAAANIVKCFKSSRRILECCSTGRLHFIATFVTDTVEAWYFLSNFDTTPPSQGVSAELASLFVKHGFAKDLFEGLDDNDGEDFIHVYAKKSCVEITPWEDVAAAFLNDAIAVLHDLMALRLTREFDFVYGKPNVLPTATCAAKRSKQVDGHCVGASPHFVGAV
jgi:hypothetical protein